jgi:predicted nucleic acid-binding protein
MLRVELRRLALRHELLDHADQLLSAVALVPMSEELLEAAETIPPSSVATPDAIHLATALELRDAGILESVLTYDSQLAEGARHHRLGVLAPTA